MPIGTSKIGVLGAGTVPGGTETFNAPGTFSVPPGVSRVNITGRGGTGNPGNAGNPGNSGNVGNGGAGGGAGAVNFIFCSCGPSSAGTSGLEGGAAYKSAWPGFNTGPGQPLSACPIGNTYFNTNINSPLNSSYARGGRGMDCFPYVCGSGNTQGQSGQSGTAGSSGNAGNAGNPGNTGNSSSTLCIVFPGGAGGNAGVAGAAGTGGSGGTGGGGGSSFGPQRPGPGAGGTGGNGGGNGGNGGPISMPGPLAPRPAGQNATIQSFGGGGAGVTNSGQNGAAGRLASNNCPPAIFQEVAAGGAGNASLTAILPNFLTNLAPNNPLLVPSMMAGPGGSSGSSIGKPAVAINLTRLCAVQINNRPNCDRKNTSQFSPYPLLIEAARAGGGGGAGPGFNAPFGQPNVYNGLGAGGGGGRGLAGNAGGASPTPSGSAATPATFNCVAVTPGGSVPVTVASPGGQIVISWNPQ